MSYFDVYRGFGYLIAEAMKIPRKYPDSKTLLPVDDSPKGKALAASRLETELELRDKVADQSKRTSRSAAALRKKGKRGDLPPPEQAVIMNNPELLKRLMQ